MEDNLILYQRVWLLKCNSCMHSTIYYTRYKCVPVRETSTGLRNADVSWLCLALLHCIWVNFNISWTWKVRQFGDDSRLRSSSWFPWGHSEVTINQLHSLVSPLYSDIFRYLLVKSRYIRIISQIFPDCIAKDSALGPKLHGPAEAPASVALEPDSTLTCANIPQVFKPLHPIHRILDILPQRWNKL